MNEEAKEERTFVVFSAAGEMFWVDAAGPKDAAVTVLRNHALLDSVNVFEASRAARYTRSFSAERAK